jgi:hypothetical protein
VSGVLVRDGKETPLAGAAVPEAVPIPPPPESPADVIARARQLWETSSPSAFAHPERKSLSGTMVQALEALWEGERRLASAGVAVHDVIQEAVEVVNTHGDVLAAISERLAKIEHHLGLLS